MFGIWEHKVIKWTKVFVHTFRGLADEQDPYLSQPDVYHQTSRPTSVASTVLDDPDFYRKKPAQMMTINENV